MRGATASHSRCHARSNGLFLKREKGLLREWLAQKEREVSGNNSGELLETALHKRHVFVDRTTASSDVDETWDCACIPSSTSASVWKIKCEVGQTIESADEVMFVLEAMKTEINIPAGEENVGKVVKGLGKGIREGATVQAGDPLVWVS